MKMSFTRKLIHKSSLYKKQNTQTHSNFFESNIANCKISDSVGILVNSQNAGIAQLVEQRIRNA